MRAAWLLPLAIGCGRVRFDARGDGGGADAACTLGPWSAPRALTQVSTSFDDYGPWLSGDRLELLVTQNRGAGGVDVRRARRTAIDAPFATPVTVDWTAGMGAADPDVSADGLTVFFDDSGFKFATRPDLASDFANAQLLSVLTIGPNGDVNPQLSPDELTIVIDTDANTPGQIHPYFATRSDVQNPFGWSAPQPLMAIWGGGTDAHVTFAGDGSFVLFGSDRASPGGASHIYQSDIVGGVYATPVLFTPTLGPNGSESDPYITPDGKTVVFASDQSGGLGAFDLYEIDRDCL